MSFERPHLRQPLGRDPITGKVVCVEQDTAAHIQSCETTIALCPLGFRVERPDFGWPWPEMKPEPIDAQPLVDALNRLEPRVQGRTAESYASLTDPATWVIEVDSEVPNG